MSLPFIRNFLFSLVFTVLLIVFGFIVIPISGTAYFIFQSMIVMLAGGLLGARWGAFSVLIWILLAVSGLPVLSGGIGGLVILQSPAGGYILGYLVSAFLIGGMVRIAGNRVSWLSLFFIYAIGGIGVINIVSICWFWFVMHVSIDLKTFLQSFVSFLPYELVKVVLAVVLTLVIYKALPALSPKGRS
ncbi:biotin transporter BioY [Shimazuella sp. AN120528]|uniref:biotin transporter BioY n=1 Tax=Shimazuella soli TaxID=1892854 RepID=UPI001F0DFBBE|nr:biotin transporter BioY [Shimazuella soli]